MTVVAFQIHALGDRDADQGSARGDAIYSALLWFRAVREATRWAICYPTLAYLAALDEGMCRAGMIADHREIMLRCDVLVATGGEMSEPMLGIVEAARYAKKPLLDLIDLGPRPSLDRHDEMRLEIRRRAAALGMRG